MLLMAHLIKSSRGGFYCERMQQPGPPLRTVGIMNASGTVARPQERQKCSAGKEEG